MPLDDHTKAAFASAGDAAKQLITLSTGILALEITFRKEVMGQLASSATTLLAVSWILFLLSVFAGVWTLLALTGSLGQELAPTARTIYRPSIRVPAFLQVLLFVAGLACTVLFGVRVLG